MLYYEESDNAYAVRSLSSRDRCPQAALLGDVYDLDSTGVCAM